MHQDVHTHSRPGLDGKLLLSLEASQRRAIEQIKARPNLWPATVGFHWGDWRLEIEIQTNRDVSEDRHLDGLLYTPWPMLYPRQIQGSDVHLELFDLPRRKGIPARLIRRGYPLDPRLKGQRYELEELFFRLPRKPVECRVEDGTAHGWTVPLEELRGEGKDHPGDSNPFLGPVTAGQLAGLTGLARELVVVLPGGRIDVRGVRCGGRLIRVGSRAEPKAA